MGDRIRLLDVMIDIASTETAIGTAFECMQQEGSHVVYFVNSNTMMLLKDHPDWKALVEESELVLPGCQSVNTGVNQVLGYQRQSFFPAGFFDNILDRAVEMGYEFMLIAADEEKFTAVQNNVHEKRPYLTFGGFSLAEQEYTQEHIVNEINSVAPDILLFALEDRQQLELLEQFKNQMNAGLILFTGNLLYEKAVLEEGAPSGTEKLRLWKLYRWLHRKGGIKTWLSNFRMRMELKKQRDSSGRTEGFSGETEGFSGEMEGFSGKTEGLLGDAEGLLGESEGASGKTEDPLMK